MNRKYYLKNMIWAGVIFSVIVFSTYDSELNISYPAILAYAFISLLLYPFAKMLVENTALKFTRRRFWQTGFFAEDIGSYGIYAVYFLVCFLFAIPLGICFVFLCFDKGK